MNHHFSHVCHLGHFPSLAEVWKRFPNGGCPGDCLRIGDILYCWDSVRHNWHEDNYTDSDSFRLLRQTGDLDLMGNIRVGGDALFQHHTLFKGDVLVEGRLVCRHLCGHDKGLFISSEALHAAIPSPCLGDWALVAEASQLQLWQCPSDGTWQLTETPAGFQPTFNLEAYNTARDIVDSIAEQGYVFCGIASPTTQPFRPTDHNIFYLATQPGEYIHFGHMQVRGLSALMWTHHADPDGNGQPEGQWTSYLLLGETIGESADDLRNEFTSALASLESQLREEFTNATSHLSSQLHDEITSAAEEMMDAGHKVVILAYMQSARPVLTSPGASALAGTMPHGTYWLDPSGPTLYAGSLEGTPPLMTWEETELSEETLYVDRNGRKLYICKNGEMVEIPTLSEPSDPSNPLTPSNPSDPSDEPVARRFNTVLGESGAFTINSEVEDITPTDVRNAYTVPNLYPDAHLGPSYAGTPHIWTAAEVGLQTGSANASQNAALIRAALADSNCIGFKLDQMYDVSVGGNVNGIKTPADYARGDTRSIIIPRDFIIDGQGTGADEGVAVGGFYLLDAGNTGNLFYTEHSLNLRYVRTEILGADGYFAYFINCANGIDQVQFTNCVFNSEQRGFRSILLYFEDSDPRGEDWVLKTTNRLNHFYMADCEARGSVVLDTSGQMYVTDTFRIVECRFTDIQEAAIHLATENTARWAQLMAYMSCPIYIAGCEFNGQAGVLRRSKNHPYEAACVENSALYMLYNTISNFISVPERPTSDPTDASRSETYDMYFNGQQLYCCNNTVSNICAIDPNHITSGIMKAKGTGFGEERMTQDLGVAVPDSTNHRRLVRCWKNNTYTLDRSTVAGWWASHLAAASGGEYENDYEAALTLDDVLRITLDTPTTTETFDEFIFENNELSTACGIAGYASGRWKATRVSIKDNTFTAARMSSEEWGPKAASDNLNYSKLSFLFSIRPDNYWGDPELYVEDNTFSVSGSTEHIRVLLIDNPASSGSSVPSKPAIWPETGKATYISNVGTNNADPTTVVGVSLVGGSGARVSYPGNQQYYKSDIMEMFTISSGL